MLHSGPWVCEPSFWRLNLRELAQFGGWPLLITFGIQCGVLSLNCQGPPLSACLAGDPFLAYVLGALTLGAQSGGLVWELPQGSQLNG